MVINFLTRRKFCCLVARQGAWCMRGTDRNIWPVCKLLIIYLTIPLNNSVQIQGIQIHIYETLGWTMFKHHHSKSAYILLIWLTNGIMYFLLTAFQIHKMHSVWPIQQNNSCWAKCRCARSTNCCTKSSFRESNVSVNLIGSITIYDDVLNTLQGEKGRNITITVLSRSTSPKNI